MARQCTVRTHASGVTAAYLLSKPKRNEINFQGESGKKSEVKIPLPKKKNSKDSLTKATLHPKLRGEHLTTSHLS